MNVYCIFRTIGDGDSNCYFDLIGVSTTIDEAIYVSHSSVHIGSRKDYDAYLSWGEKGKTVIEEVKLKVNRKKNHNVFCVFETFGDGDSNCCFNLVGISHSRVDAFSMARGQTLKNNFSSIIDKSYLGVYRGLRKDCDNYLEWLNSGETIIEKMKLM